MPKDDLEAVQHLYGRSEDSWFTTKSGPTSPKKSPSSKGSLTPTYPSPTAPTKGPYTYDICKIFGFLLGFLDPLPLVRIYTIKFK